MNHDMKLTDDYMKQYKEKCLHEFMDSPEGAQYKQSYESLKTQMDSLMSEVDKHVYRIMRDKMM